MLKPDPAIEAVLSEDGTEALEGGGLVNRFKDARAQRRHRKLPPSKTPSEQERVLVTVDELVIVIGLLVDRERLL